jgi:hypothetical protein
MKEMRSFFPVMFRIDFDQQSKADCNSCRDSGSCGKLVFLQF